MSHQSSRRSAKTELARGFALLTAVTAIFVAGCQGRSGPQLAEVRGAVKLDNKPLSNALVEFTPDEGSASFGVTNQAGEYVLRYTRRKPGAALGRHSVRITAWKDNLPPKTKPPVIPVCYNEETVLEAVIVDGDNQFDFPLESKQPKKVARR